VTIKPDESKKVTADTFLKAGTVWKGLASYVYPSSFPKDFVVELTIIRRDGNNFEGIYKTGRGRISCEMRGAVADGSIELRVTKILAGRIDFEKTPLIGVISGDRIDFELKTTFEGEPHYAKGLLIRAAGTGGTR
jgi:hypothetical protein